MRLLPVLSLLLLSLWGAPAHAEMSCPRQLSMPDLEPVTEQFIAILKSSYQKLGCDPEILSFPGRRGIYSYNHGQVDGETFRLPVVEVHYGRPFIRSEVPLFYIGTGVCSRPDHSYVKEQPIAYVRGVIWHENYVGEPAFRQREAGLVFDSQEQVFTAYNNGLIDHFLCETLVLRSSIAEQRFEVLPVLSRSLERDPAYHYLDQQYAEFMARFSELLKTEDPFAILN